MRKYFLSALLLLVMQAALAQSSNLAKLKFEDAEDAYAKSDYKLTLTKLDEAEKSLGKINPPIAYLRIMAQNNIINAETSDSTLLRSALKNCAYYLKTYDNITAVADKYREVYNINDNLLGLKEIAKVQALLKLPEYQQGYDFYKKKDYVNAMVWLKKAADKGNGPAMTMIGFLYKAGVGVNKDYTEAMNWFRKAAGKNYYPAFLYIGQMYLSGSGVSKDSVEAMNWFKKAADSNYPAAFTQIAHMYHYGYGVKRDVEAMALYKKAADKGDKGAFTYIGSMYYFGAGVPQDYTEAMKWYKKAADKVGSTIAMYNIGQMYFNGYGVAKNEAEAMPWYKKAADNGNTGAMAALALMYRNGTGTNKDIQLADEWQAKADAIIKNRK